MATIQIKRRTSAGSGPLTGTSGAIKAGEPLVDFNGEHLYISKKDKTASSSTPLVDGDYLKIPSTGKVDSTIIAKINALSLGTASKKNVGTGSGNIPLLDANGKLVDSVVPKIAMTNTFVVSSQSSMLSLSTAQEGDVAVRTDLNKSYILKATPYSTVGNWQELLTPTDKVISVNGSTGAVTVSLSGLGGVSNTLFNNHVTNVSHLTPTQRAILENVKIAQIVNADGINLASSLSNYNATVLDDGLRYLPVVDTDYTPSKIMYKLGIDKSKVLTPSSIIDGGTF